VQVVGRQGAGSHPVYASGGYVTDDPDNQLDRQLERLAGRGYGAYKIKIGLSVASDVERCRLARRIIGDDALLFVDINGNYSADLVIASMRAVERFDIAFVEEPLPPQDYDGYDSCRASSACRSRSARRTTPCTISTAWRGRGAATSCSPI